MKLTKENLSCAVCGKQSEQTIVLSYSKFDYDDMDFRPKDTSILAMRIQECPHCQYCNFDISKPRSAEVVEHYDRENLINGTENKDVRKILLMAAQLDRGEFCRYLVVASWIARDIVVANNLKKRAVDSFVNFYKKHTSELLLQMADTARQIKDFKNAKLFADTAKKKAKDKTLKKLIAYELELIKNQDCDCHSMGDVLKDKEADKKIVIDSKEKYIKHIVNHKLSLKKHPIAIRAPKEVDGFILTQEALNVFGWQSWAKYYNYKFNFNGINDHISFESKAKREEPYKSLGIVPALQKNDKTQICYNYLKKNWCIFNPETKEIINEKPVISQILD